MWFSSSAPPDSGVRQSNSSAALSAVVYRSRAVSPLSGQDLQGLMQAAQARNRREAVTGVMLYDESRFFQWLEGPTDGVSRILHAIREDTRHTDIEILANGPAPSRSFSDWDMKLATRSIGRALWQGEVIEPSPDIIDGLRRHPRRAADLLLKLVKVPSSVPPGSTLPVQSVSRAPMTRATASVLRAAFLDTVVPELLLRQKTPAAQPRPTTPTARASELADLLLSCDETASLQLIRELCDGDAGLGGLYSPLFEAAARNLGDLWADDFCSEFDLTLGLTRLQTAARLLGMAAPQPLQRGFQPNVLIVPAPGELHNLGATLDAEWLWQRGWAPHCDFPANDRALEDLVADSWVDVLDLSLSAAFRRNDRLSGLRKTIALARHASRNAELVVIVGGRVFAEHRSEGPAVGADVASRTSQGVDRRMLAGLATRAGSSSDH